MQQAVKEIALDTGPQAIRCGINGQRCKVELRRSTINTLFNDALLKYFDGKPDQLTIHLLARPNTPRC